MGNSTGKNGLTNGKDDVSPTDLPNTDPATPPTPKEPLPTSTRMVKETLTNIGCWNVQRGLLKRETEIKNLIQEQDLDVLILVETDTNMLSSEKDYMIYLHEVS